LKFFSEFHFKK